MRQSGNSEKVQNPKKKMPNWLYSILCLLLILSLFFLMFGIVGNLVAMNKLDLTIVLTLIFFGLGTISCIASFKSIWYLPFAVGFWFSAVAYYFTKRFEVLLAPIVPAAFVGAYLRRNKWKKEKDK